MRRTVSIRGVAGFLALFMIVIPISGLSQTKIQAHKNKYTPAQDTELGRQAANEVEHKMPLIRDQQSSEYLQRVGQRLADAIPPEFQHPEFRYTFKIVDAKEINAFALPGGPMFVNRGMIESAKTEGEMAGVMAHEISHVALRHGTAQVTKAESYKTLGMLGGLAGSVIGGGAGSIISQGAQMGTGMYLLKFSREYETEADVLGSQIMARAGYDPRDLANMFKTIEQQGGSGGTPQFLSSHPNPENRYQRIEQEAAALRVTDPIRESQDFNTIKGFLAYGGQVDRGGRGDALANSGNSGNSGRIGERVEAPSANYRTFTSPNNQYRLSFPDNWRNVSSDNSVWLVPEGAYGELQGKTVITHGVNVGTIATQSRDLRQATDQFIRALQQGNPQLNASGSYTRATLAGRDALQMSLNNVSEVNGRPEVISVRTTLLRDGSLFYVIALAPQDNYQNFQPAFQNLLKSLQIVD